MKHVYVYFFFCMAIQAQIHIPDTNFKIFLVREYDLNGDSEISQSEAAAVTGLLNCSHQGLVDLTGIEHFINVEVLYCYANQLSSLPDLSNLRNLRELWCNNNELTQLPPLSTLLALERVMCYSNQITTLPILSSLPSLDTVSCHLNNLDSCSFPELALLRDKSLTNFDFSPQNNGPISIPADPIICFESSALKTVLLATGDSNSDGEISLSEALNYPNTVDVSSANLTSLDGIQYFGNTQTLYCHYNQLTRLPDMGMLTSLEGLDCSNNRLKTLPDLRACVNLAQLDCRSNQLIELPPFPVPSQIWKLECAANQLTDLSDCVIQPNLVELGCSDNSLTALPSSLNANPMFSSLLCEGNNLSQLPDMDNTQVDTIICKNNKLNELPDLSTLGNLFILNADSNQLVDISGLEGHVNLLFLSLNNNLLLEPPTLIDMPMLAQVSLEGNRLNRLPQLSNLPELSGLRLGFNNLTSLTIQEPLPKLHLLAADHNLIESIDGLTELPILKVLRLKGNRLTSLPDLPPNTDYIDLRFNLLDNEDCPWISELSQDRELRAFKYLPQGGTHLLGLDFEAWPSNEILLNWIAQISQGDHLWDFDCFNPDPILGNMQFVPAGTFMQGSPVDEPCRFPGEEARFTHSISYDFWVMETEVTRQMWADMMDLFTYMIADPTDLNFGADMNHPVQDLSPQEAYLFANLLYQNRGLRRCYYKDAEFSIPITVNNYNSPLPLHCDFSANGYRLPTEGEWEYFARAGTETPFSIDEPNYNSSTCADCTPGILPLLESASVFCSTPMSSPDPVGQRAPNPWGIKDVHGNVWEWCWDWFDPYPTSTQTDYRGPASGFDIVVRGGCWADNPSASRSAQRGYIGTFAIRHEWLGFRLVRNRID